DQLKIRGEWISIAEIEAVLRQVNGVREAGVIVRDKGQKDIVAFVSWKNGSLSDKELRAVLRERLPAHSLPHHFFGITQMPLLPNGKIDRMALRLDAEDRLQNRVAKQPPGDSLSLQLVRVWESVLPNARVDGTSNFFELGGDSLAAATMLAAVEKFFG